MKNEVKKWEEIKIKVGLNKDNLPIDLKWSASANSSQGVKDCKAFNLGIWDPVENNSLSINLWTNSMTVDEMKVATVSPRSPQRTRRPLGNGAKLFPWMVTVVGLLYGPYTGSSELTLAGVVGS